MITVNTQWGNAAGPRGSHEYSHERLNKDPTVIDPSIQHGARLSGPLGLKISGAACVQVVLIDEGLLKFSKLEELVLSANNITEIPAENLPITLEAS